MLENSNLPTSEAIFQAGPTSIVEVSTFVSEQTPLKLTYCMGPKHLQISV